jgi:hypothetical protein
VRASSQEAKELEEIGREGAEERIGMNPTKIAQVKFKATSGNTVDLEFFDNLACDVGWDTNPTKADIVEIQALVEVLFGGPSVHVHIEDDNERSHVLRDWNRKGIDNQ